MKVRTSVLTILGLAFASGAMAETVNCTAITTVPYAIYTPGTYCLTKDFSTSMTGTVAAIDIVAKDVVLDLNGHTLSNSAGSGLGVSASASNITIRNGTVRGFAGGVRLWADQTAPGNVIEQLLIVGSTSYGISATGDGTTIRNNRVLKTTNTPDIAWATGIHSEGPNARILNNDVMDVASPAGFLAWGISVAAANGTVIAGNRISKLTVSAGSTDSTGIRVATGANITIRDNNIADARNGIQILSGATAKYMGNMTQGVTTPYTGGTAAGTTNY